MLKFAFITGLGIDEFWNMTFFEFEIWCDAYNIKQKNTMQQLITQAYMTAALSRTKSMPDLEDLLKDNTEEMTDQKIFDKMSKPLKRR